MSRERTPGPHLRRICARRGGRARSALGRGRTGYEPSLFAISRPAVSRTSATSAPRHNPDTARQFAPEARRMSVAQVASTRAQHVVADGRRMATSSAKRQGHKLRRQLDADRNIPGVRLAMPARVDETPAITTRRAPPPRQIQAGPDPGLSPLDTARATRAHQGSKGPTTSRLQVSRTRPRDGCSPGARGGVSPASLTARTLSSWTAAALGATGRLADWRRRTASRSRREEDPC